MDIQDKKDEMKQKTAAKTDEEIKKADMEAKEASHKVGQKNAV